MTSYFCVFCGTKTEGNTVGSVVSNNWNLSCNDCGGSVGFYVHHRPTKTDEEIEAAFQNTPLTDSQRGTKRHSSPIRKKA
jgi:hypothetical protein